MKDSNIYGTFVNSAKNFQKTISKNLSVTGGDTGFASFLLIVVGLVILVTIIVKANSMENFTYQLEDGRVGDRLTGKIKNIKGSHLEKKCYGSTGIYYGDKVPKNIEGFSVNDDRKIMGENLTGDIKIKSKYTNLKDDWCCCQGGSCRRTIDCSDGMPVMPCLECNNNCK